MVLAEYRTEVMGFAIILIMLFHLGVLPFGECGVDIFLFLSGFSMYRSLNKNKDVLPFYKKRLLRILPCYLIIAVPYLCVKTNTLPEFLLKLTNLSIINSGEMGGWWFITMILMCYFLSPFIYRMLEKMNMGGQFLMFLLLLVMCIGVGESNENIRIFVVRFPAFFLGMCLGFDKFTSKRCFVSFEIVIAVLLTVCFGFLLLKEHSFWVYRKSFYTLIVYPLVLGIMLFVGRVPIWIKNMLAYLGRITLELYLVHENLMVPLAKFICGFGAEGYLFEGSYRILSVLLSIPFALILHQITNKIIYLVRLL